MKSSTSNQKTLNIYLGIMAIVGMMIIYIATSRFGPGVSGDSVRYLSVAENLLEGRGFYDYSLAPLLAWPPLYSLLLALLAIVTRDVFIAGWALNIGLFGLTIVLTGRLIAMVVPEQPIYPLLAAVVIMVLPSLIRVYSIIAADGLFMVLCLLFFHQGTQYLRSGKVSNQIWMGIISILASLVKYPGLILSLLGCILIVVYHYRLNKNRTGLLHAAFFFVASTLPLTTWVIAHNWILHNSLFGDRGYAQPLGNIYIAVEKVLYWFIPYSIIQRTNPIVLLIFILLAALLIIQPESWRRWLARLSSAEILPLLLFTILYGLTLVFLVSYSEHHFYRVDRLHIALIFPVLAFLASAAVTLRLRWESMHRSWVVKVLAGVAFLVWLAYPINNSRKYIVRSLAEGEAENNLYNTRALRESEIVQYLESNQFLPNETLYSNHEGAAWFYTRHNVLVMPQGDRQEEDQQDAAKVLEQYASWPPEPGYIIWFDLGFKLHVLPPDELTSHAVITPLFESESGGVYQVAPR